MLVNAEWSAAGALTGRAAALPASFEVVYCFEPIAVRVRAQNLSGAVTSCSWDAGLDAKPPKMAACLWGMCWEACARGCHPCSSLRKRLLRKIG